MHGETDNIAFNLAYPLGLLDTNNESNPLQYLQKLFDSSGNVISNDIDENMESFDNKYFIDGAPEEVDTSAESYGEFVQRA